MAITEQEEFEFRLKLENEAKPKLDTATVKGDVTEKAYSTPPPLTPRQERWQQKPFYEKMARGATEAVLGPVRGAGMLLRKPFMSEEDYQARQQELGEMGDYWRESTEGDPLSATGAVFGEVGSLISPMSKISKLNALRKFGLKFGPTAQSIATGIGQGGLSGTVRQSGEVGRGGEFSVPSAGIEALASGVIPSAVKGGIKGANYLAKESAETLGQVPIEGLEMWGSKQGREALKKSWQQELPTAKDMVKKVFNAGKTLPETNQVKAVVSKMPKIDAQPVLQEIDNAINKISLKNTNSPMIAKLKKLKSDWAVAKEAEKKSIMLGEETVLPAKVFQSKDGWKIQGYKKHPNKLGIEKSGPEKSFKTKEEAFDYAKNQMGHRVPKPQDLRVSAESLRNKRIEMDDIIDWTKPGASKMNDLLIGVRRKAEGLLQQNAPKEYQPLMAQYADKINKISKLKSKLGNKNVAEERAFTLLRGVDNDSRQVVKEIVQNFDNTFGTNYVQKAELMHMGRMLGKAGKDKMQVPLWPKGATGNRPLALLAGGAGMPAYASQMLKIPRGAEKAYDYLGGLGRGRYPKARGTIDDLLLQTGRSTVQNTLGGNQ
jgi:hypothetical protein